MIRLRYIAHTESVPVGHGFSVLHDAGAFLSPRLTDADAVRICEAIARAERARRRDDRFLALVSDRRGVL